MLCGLQQHAKPTDHQDNVLPDYMALQGDPDALVLQARVSCHLVPPNSAILISTLILTLWVIVRFLVPRPGWSQTS